MTELLVEGSVAASSTKCILLLLAACLSSACAIVSTPKSGSGSLFRYAWLIVIIANGKLLIQTISTASTSIVINGVFAGLSALVLLQCCNLLAITRLDRDDLMRDNIFRESDGFFYKILRTNFLMFNLRGIGTSWQTQRLNRFPSFYERYGDHGKPSRGSYIVRELLIISWQYLFLDIVFISSLDTKPEDIEKLFGSGMEFVYLHATAEQWATRVVVGVISWLAPARVTLDIGHRFLSVLSVLLGISSPDDWPPLFGSIWDVYTLRGFWSTFWHQYCRWPLTSISNFLCRDILSLPRPSLLERYLNLTIVFLASGIFHVVVDMLGSQPPAKAPTLAFFSFFALGIMIEDGVQELCRRITGVNTWEASQSIPVWYKLVGYLWVSLWFTITSPWYLYHPSRLPAEIKWLVPVSAVRLIGPSAAHMLLVAGGLVLKFAIGGEI